MLPEINQAKLKSKRYRYPVWILYIRITGNTFISNHSWLISLKVKNRWEGPWLDSEKDDDSEVNSAVYHTQTGFVSPPTQTSVSNKVDKKVINHGDDKDKRGKPKNPPGLVHADGKLTKNDKSVPFDVTSHVITKDTNKKDSNRIILIDDIDFEFNHRLDDKLKDRYNLEWLNGSRDL